jgi:predicted DNA-binding transcriptional regulator YafY
MARASTAQRARRLNLSRILLQRCSSLSQAVQRLAKAYSISSRQAYRYIKQAQRLQHPVPVTPPKIAFTVKLPAIQIRQLRLYAARARLTLSEVVSRALTALLEREQRHG